MKKKETAPRIAKALVIAAIVVVVIGIISTLLGSRERQGRSLSNVSSSAAPYLSEPMMVSEAPMAKRMDMQDMAMAPEGSGMMSDSEASVPDIEKKMIKNGNLTLRVENAEWSAGEIARIAQSMGGDVFSSDLADNGAGIKSGTVTVKVPVARFDEAIKAFKPIAKAVLNESVSGQDVTAQYVDLEARLKNKHTEEEAFAAILSRQTDKIADVLAATRELARVRGEIEQLQAQMKYLESQTDMATITVFVSEDAKIGKVDTWRPWQVIKDAVNILIKNLQWLVNFLIGLVIIVIPILLILFVLFGVILWRLGKKLYAWLRK